MSTARKIEITMNEEWQSLLQGNLQNVFDALYHLGVIDPVLEMDWVKEMEAADLYRDKIDLAIIAANAHQNSVDRLISELKNFDEKTLGYLAMEVAREFADFHSRESLH
tara:strand:- start:1212 stop:1538 length:327 start_codon:yes stop_codon:yes gene_type:complete